MSSFYISFSRWCNKDARGTTATPGILASDWSRVIAWPGYRPLIGREPQQHQEWSGPKSELVCHFWNSRKTAMTIISQQLATRTVKHIQKMSPRYLDTGIWLIKSDHVTWILASEWLWDLGTWCKYSWLMNSKLHLLDGCQSESILTPHLVLNLA